MKTIKLITFLTNSFLLLYLLYVVATEGLGLFGNTTPEIALSIFTFAIIISNIYISWESYSKQ